ncbi:MFS transporter [Burkholderia ubonensis]|uniref:MFS transporter n=1 Tax=Burkholderia ubonensis TaxID=101571 RepID=UPI00075F40B0|nr:MFS transporter [Burkholderia ubonensis]KVS41285.1 MFS transporter [Burkholderia ubonensis]KVS42292.1 MFS transporter [Burkholderia ubonensis]KVS74484.1 MFS transporter [Burkholderia ubonensis]KVS85725.1 MFS transporter [Burkholderia ubonensis]KVS85837.1 MFS transporter [Burkholderia ubonensis]
MSTDSASTPRSGFAVTLQIVSVVCFTFICYLTIGLPLAVLPGFVHDELGFSAIVAGAAISVQYFATLASRPLAGRFADTLGPKQTVMRGLIGCGVSGVLLLVALLLAHWPAASLVLLVASRLVLGVGESLCGTGAILWGIGRVGIAHNAKVISWNGIATYGALALGAPVGVAIAHVLNPALIGVIVIALGYALARLIAAVPVVHGERMSYASVFTRVLPHGLGLALGSAGFGSIATFVTLYYAARHWPNAALSLTVFGTLFIGARLLFANTIKTYGGFRVAIVSFAFEAAGLLLLWLAPVPHVALVGAALTGFGFALIFPALGVEAVALVPPASRGAALSAYSVFLDLSLGITGPLAGYVAGAFGYPQVFLFAALASAAGVALSTLLYQRQARVAGSGAAA